MVTALTLCEMAFPLRWCTITKHALLHMFEPDIGRIALYGAMAFFHMNSFERWNKFLRALLKARKNMEKSCFQRYRRYAMVTIERMRDPSNFSLPPMPSRAVAYDGGRMEVLPAYHRQSGEAGARTVTDQGRRRGLSAKDARELSAYFKRCEPDVIRAHARKCEINYRFSRCEYFDIV